MTKRVCPQPGCPTLTDGGRCTTHARQQDKARGTRQQRGYDADHEAARKRWAPIVATGSVRCRRAPYGHCLMDDPLIRPGDPWHLGHPDSECPAPRAPEHQRCNVSTAGRR